MPRTPARFTKAEVSRAIQAVLATGSIMSIEIAPDGTIRIVPYQPGQKRPSYVPDSPNDIIL